ncbi:MAG: hypothetical protein K5669_08395 [Lachnospiraceae bacterium]|nr:hypothetical protein [Lachnospiraceae bacterium]
MEDYRYTNREYYEYGSVARNSVAPERRYEPDYERRHAKRPHKGSSFSVLGFAIAGVAFVVFAISMVNYVQLQSELTGKVKSVAAKQVKLNDLKSSNDEHYARITSSVDLESIENIARGELGMTYASEGQVITYVSAGNDYMRKADGN